MLNRKRRRETPEEKLQRLLLEAGYDIPSKQERMFLFPNKCWICGGCLLLQANIHQKPTHRHILDTNVHVSLPFDLDPRDDDYPQRLKQAYIEGVCVCDQKKKQILCRTRKGKKVPRKDQPVPANEAEHSVSQVLLQDVMAGQMTSDRAKWLCDMIENGTETEKAVALSYAANLFIIMKPSHERCNKGKNAMDVIARISDLIMAGLSPAADAATAAGLRTNFLLLLDFIRDDLCGQKHGEWSMSWAGGDNAWLTMQFPVFTTPNATGRWADNKKKAEGVEHFGTSHIKDNDVGANTIFTNNVVRSQIGKHYLEMVAAFKDKLYNECSLPWQSVPDEKKVEILKECWDFAIELYIQETFTSIVGQCMQTIESLDRFKTSQEYQEFMNASPGDISSGGRQMQVLLDGKNKPSMNIINRLKGLIGALSFDDIDILTDVRRTPDFNMPPSSCPSVPGQTFDEKISEVRHWLQGHIDSLDDEAKTSPRFGGQEFRKPRKYNEELVKLGTRDVSRRQENITHTERELERAEARSLYWFSADDVLQCLEEFCPNPAVVWAVDVVEPRTRSGQTPTLIGITGTVADMQYVRLELSSSNQHWVVKYSRDHWREDHNERSGGDCGPSAVVMAIEYMSGVTTSSNPPSPDRQKSSGAAPSSGFSFPLGGKNTQSGSDDDDGDGSWRAGKYDEEKIEYKLERCFDDMKLRMKGGVSDKIKKDLTDVIDLWSAGENWQLEQDGDTLMGHETTRGAKTTRRGALFGKGAGASGIGIRAGMSLPQRPRKGEQASAEGRRAHAFMHDIGYAWINKEDRGKAFAECKVLFERVELSDGTLWWEQLSMVPYEQRYVSSSGITKITKMMKKNKREAAVALPSLSLSSSSSSLSSSSSSSSSLSSSSPVPAAAPAAAPAAGDGSMGGRGRIKKKTKREKKRKKKTKRKKKRKKKTKRRRKKKKKTKKKR